MPNRVLRDWTASEKMDQLSADAEVFFTRLIMKADDFGIYLGNPKLLKSALYPLRDNIKDDFIIKCIAELCGANLVIYYEVDGKKYVKIHDYGQRLRQMKSKFPEPSDGSPSIVSISRPETKRNETETKPKPKLEDAALLPWNSDEFAAAWAGYKEFLKVEKNASYKSVKTENSALAGLVKKSNNNEAAAIAIIMQSIENNWRGLFELKNQNQQHNGAGAGVDVEYLEELKTRLTHGGNS